MSVKELVLCDSPIKIKFVKMKLADQFAVTVYDTKIIAGIILDRNQAHLLMLYLQEHLND